ncbi:hypothetical protein GCM10007052_17250 [Halioglobus japonicus]|nr:hypothetical protein GCM10007052_17250 [Halioglobus japonicus]
MALHAAGPLVHIHERVEAVLGNNLAIGAVVATLSKLLFRRNMAAATHLG